MLHKNLRTFFKWFILLAISIVLVYQIVFHLKLHFGSQRLEHECECFKDKILKLRKIENEKYFIEYDGKSYTINSKLQTFTCNLYKSLSRGPGQKIVSYSLYGKNYRYYKLISNLTRWIKKFYPDHVMRVYHDNTINESIACELECKNPHVEFCNIHKVPTSLDNLKSTVDLNYIHSTMWRFLPIGDSYVDLFMSRDSDSMIIQREFDSVQEWIKSENVGHIMRDHPQHGTHILAGMWGFKTKKDRRLANQIYNLVINRILNKNYNPGGQINNGYDQFFLSEHVYNKINERSTVHDSFLCKTYPNSKPFPTKRIGDCFVAVIGSCNENGKFYACPRECRPADHKDWEYC